MTTQRPHLRTDCWCGRGQVSASPASSNPSPEHGYGLTSDCVCGRNFATVRGLREHLTKTRVIASAEGDPS